MPTGSELTSSPRRPQTSVILPRDSWSPTTVAPCVSRSRNAGPHLTQVWLAACDDPKANVTGEYFYHLKRLDPNPQANDPALQNDLIAICAKISGEALPPDSASSGAKA
jgi:hypothetical protein